MNNKLLILSECYEMSCVPLFMALKLVRANLLDKLASVNLLKPATDKMPLTTKGK